MIGIVDARRQLGSILAAAPVARVVDATGVEHVEYRDPSGSTLFGHIAGGELVCLTPFFRAPTPSMWRVDTSSVCVDADCVHCSGIDVDIYAGDDTEGAFTTRTTLQLVRGAAFAADRMRTIVDRAVVAFARRVDTFADADAFHADSKTAAVLAVPSFLPTGLFGPAGDVGARAMCTFVGTVRDRDASPQHHRRAFRAHRGRRADRAHRRGGGCAGGASAVAGEGGQDRGRAVRDGLTSSEIPRSRRRSGTARVRRR
jgi:hypothetical protein